MVGYIGLGIFYVHNNKSIVFKILDKYVNSTIL